MRAIIKITSKLKKKLFLLNDERIESILLLLFAFYIAAIVFDASVIGQLHPGVILFCKFIRYIFYLACTINIFRNLLLYGYDHLTWPVIFIVGLSIAIFLISRRQYPLCICLMLGGMHRISFKRILKCTFITSTLLFLILITLSILNIVPDWIYLREDGNIRHALGYDWPGNTAKAFFLIVLMYFYKHNKVKNEDIALLFICTILLFCLTDARTDCLLCIVVVLALWALTNTNLFSRDYSRKVWRIINAVVPWALTAVFVLFCVLYSKNSSIAQRLDILLSSRLQLTVNAWKKYGLTLFGQQINWKGWGGVGYIISTEEYVYDFVDNAYMQMMFDYGVLFLIAFLISASLTILEATYKHNNKLIFVLILLFIWASIEPSILELGQNVFLILFAKTLTRFGKLTGSSQKLSMHKINSASHTIEIREF